MSTSTTNYGLTKPAAGELYSRVVMNNNNDIIDTELKAVDAEQETRALGYMPESKTRTSVSSVIGSTVSVIENIATFTFKANRRYRISWNCSYTITVAGDYFSAKIQTCSTADSSSANTGLTELIKRSISAWGASAGTPMYIEQIQLYAVDTTLQVKFTINRALGTGGWQMEAERAIFCIEDLGLDA